NVVAVAGDAAALIRSLLHLDTTNERARARFEDAATLIRAIRCTEGRVSDAYEAGDVTVELTRAARVASEVLRAALGLDALVAHRCGRRGIAHPRSGAAGSTAAGRAPCAAARQSSGPASGRSSGAARRHAAEST